jgi:hypothetical protein
LSAGNHDAKLGGRSVLIESTLFFSLGFLCAAFLALMIAPALWRRAVALTRKRIEASVPLSLGEIEADKDRIRRTATPLIADPPERLSAVAAAWALA